MHCGRYSLSVNLAINRHQRRRQSQSRSALLGNPSNPGQRLRPMEASRNGDLEISRPGNTTACRALIRTTDLLLVDPPERCWINEHANMTNNTCPRKCPLEWLKALSCSSAAARFVLRRRLFHAGGAAHPNWCSPHRAGRPPFPAQLDEPKYLLHIYTRRRRLEVQGAMAWSRWCRHSTPVLGSKKINVQSLGHLRTKESAPSSWPLLHRRRHLRGEMRQGLLCGSCKLCYLPALFRSDHRCTP